MLDDNTNEQNWASDRRPPEQHLRIVLIEKNKKVGLKRKPCHTAINCAKGAEENLPGSLKGQVFHESGPSGGPPPPQIPLSTQRSSYRSPSSLRQGTDLYGQAVRTLHLTSLHKELCRYTVACTAPVIDRWRVGIRKLCSMSHTPEARSSASARNQNSPMQSTGTHPHTTASLINGPAEGVPLALGCTPLSRSTQQRVAWAYASSIC